VRLTGAELAAALEVADFVATTLADRDDAPARLIGMLSGVLAKSPADAALLRRLAADLTGSNLTAPSQLATPAARDTGMRPGVSRAEAVSAVELALAVGGVAAASLARPQRRGATTDEPTQDWGASKSVDSAPPPTAQLALKVAGTTATVEVLAAPPVWRVWLPALSAAAPLLLALAAIVIARRRRPLWRRLPAEQQERRIEAEAFARAASLFTGGGVRAVARSLRRAPRDAAGPLDIRETITATAGRFGIFTPIHGAPRGDRSIHILIEQAGLHDHLAAYSALLADRLVAAGAPATLFRYRRDPRTVWGADGRPQRLAALAPAEPGAALIVMGEAEGLLHPKLAAGEGLLQAWSHRVVLTRRPLAAWSQLEEALVTAGWSVAPLDSRAFDAVAALFDTEQPSARLLGVRKLAPEPPGDPAGARDAGREAGLRMQQHRQQRQQL